MAIPRDLRPGAAVVAGALARPQMVEGAAVKTSDKGLHNIMLREGCRLEAYPDPGTGGAPYTIGYGHTAGVHEGDWCTQEQAAEWLKADVVQSENAVMQLVDVQLTQGEFDALVDFVFNLGAGALAGSTLLKLLNAGRYHEAAQQFPLWVHASGHVLPGLVARRAEEEAEFEGAGQ
jgi:lysozyme